MATDNASSKALSKLASALGEGAAALTKVATALGEYAVAQAAEPVKEDPPVVVPPVVIPPPVVEPPVVVPPAAGIDRTKPIPLPAFEPSAIEVDVADGVAMVPVTLSFPPKATVIAVLQSINGTAKSGQHYSGITQQMVWHPGDPATKWVAVKVYGQPKDGDAFGFYMANVENPGAQPIRERWSVTFRKGAKQPGAGQTPCTYAPKAFPAPAASPVWQMDMSAPLVATDSGLDAQGKPCFADRLLHGREQPNNGEWGYYEPNLPFMRGGELILPAKKLAAPESRPTNSGPKTFGYLASILSTFKNCVFTYGYAEADILLATQPAAWPAFWILPTDQSWPPEIDIMEDPRDSGNNGRRPGPNAHWGSQSNHQKYPGRQFDIAAMIGVNDRLDAGYHKFGCLWTADKIVMTVDRKVTMEMPNYYGDKPSFMMLNNAVGGWAAPGNDPKTLAWDDAKAEMKVRSWTLHKA